MKFFSALLSLVFPLLLFSINVCSQEQNPISRVIYKIRQATTPENDSLEMRTSPVAKKLADKTMNALEEVECELFFDTTSSLFRRKEKLALEKDFGYRSASVFAGGVRYKNLKDKIKIEQRHSLGETLTIYYPFAQYNWKISKEKRTISGYTCYKATATIEERDIISDTIKHIMVTAWFTPEIPAPFGPKGIDGLPGLVVEGTTNGKIFFYMEAFQPAYSNDKNILKKPKGGIDITEEKYVKLLYEKMTPILKRDRNN